MESVSRKKRCYFVKEAYTREQKIVAGVWLHERHYTGMTFKQLQINFRERFKTRPPNRSVIGTWEKRLFNDGKKRGPNLESLVYVPYVRESLMRYPDLSINQRSDMLGIANDTLRRILKIHFTSEEIELLKNTGHCSSNEEHKSSDTCT